MPNSNSTLAAKRTYATTFFMMMFANLVYLALAWSMAHNHAHVARPAYFQQRIIVTLISLVSLVASVLIFRKGTDGKIGDDGLPPVLTGAEFQNLTVRAMSFATWSAILGMYLFFVGMPFHIFIFYVAATVIVELAFFLPAGLRYWAAMEKAGG